MTAAEALRELRLLIAHELRRDARDVNWPVVKMMLYDVRLLIEDGWCGSVIELRIRRYRRRAGLRVV
jgi:hypothetical protein